jgi:hypothetical protein
MRIKFCKKILSNDHAFGFILNTMETQRVEQLGRKIWKGESKDCGSILSIFYVWGDKRGNSIK